MQLGRREGWVIKRPFYFLDGCGIVSLVYSFYRHCFGCGEANDSNGQASCPDLCACYG